MLKMVDNEEVTLQIENKEFKVKKSLLCEHSDYFRAMFSGNYIENDQNQIVIDVSTYTFSKDLQYNYTKI